MSPFVACARPPGVIQAAITTVGRERLTMRATKRQTDTVRVYTEDQAHEEVVHLEKAASELVGPVRHDIWDVHCTDSRWWVITEPMNLVEPGS
jgi:hypothetical protein